MNNIKICNTNSIKPKHKKEHEPYEYYKYQVTPMDKNSKCCVAVYKIPPQKSAYPYHYHVNNEEVFYIISGEGILETPQGNKKVGTGDIIVCPPDSDSAHRLINSSETEFLTYIDFDSVNYPDVAYYPKSNKVGIILAGESSAFYDEDKNVDYYKGE